jgi:hypothetical protein
MPKHALLAALAATRLPSAGKQRNNGTKKQQRSFVSVLAMGTFSGMVPDSR